MKRKPGLKIFSVFIAAVAAVLIVGTAFAWFYEKDQTETVVNLGDAVPVTETIFAAVLADPVTAIQLDNTLRFCASDDVVALSCSTCSRVLGFISSGIGSRPCFIFRKVRPVVGYIA